MTGRDMSVVALAVSAVAAYTVLLWRKAIVFGVTWNWVFPYIGSVVWMDILVAAVAAAIVFWLTLKALRLFPQNRLSAAGLLLVCGMLFLLTANSRRLFSAEEIMVNIKAESFYDASTMLSARDIMVHSDKLARMFPAHQHLHTNFPGKLLYYKLLALAGGGAFFAVMANLLLSCAGAALVFLSGRLLFESPRAGLFASLFYLFAPQRAYFFPLLNLITPLFLLVVLLSAIMAVRRKSTLWAALYGVLVVCAALFDPVPLVFLFFATAAVWACAIYARKASVGDMMRFAGLGAASIAVCLLILWIFFDYSYLRNLSAASTGNRHYSPFPREKYWSFYFINLKTYLVDLGLSLVVALGWGAVRIARKTLPFPQVVFFAASLLSLLVLDGIAFAGAEGTRVWLFMLVPFCLCAGAFMEECDDRTVALFAALLAFQALPTIAHIGFILI